MIYCSKGGVKESQDYYYYIYSALKNKPDMDRKGGIQGEKG